MAKESLGGKLEQQYEQIKGGLKNLAQKVTEEDTEPRTDAMAGRRRGAEPVTKARKTSAKARAGAGSVTKQAKSRAGAVTKQAKGRGGSDSMTKESRARGTSGAARATSGAMTKEQLYADAKRMGVKGRSKMTKDELAKALRRR